MKVVDLFSGCGGLSRGFQNAGFEVLAAFDNWEPAIAVYELNFNHAVNKMNLNNTADAVRAISALRPDMICGGPPCQDFSHAGKRSEGRNADLTRAYALIVSEVKPRWFVMENVDRVFKSDAYRRARAIIKKAGYGLTERILDASLCGVPQKRKRFFCVGLLDADDGFMAETLDAGLSNDPTTVREYLGEELGIEFYYRHPRNYNRRGIFSIDEAAPTVRGVNRPVPVGYKGHPGDPVKVSRKLRPLTTLERARLQTFPPEYKWTGSKTDLEQMIGNAVPVRLAEFVAAAIVQFEEEQRLQGKADIA